MKHYEKRIIPESEKDVLVKTTCDSCGKDLKSEKESPYDVLETHIFMKTGLLYPEGGSGEIISYDICQECFCNKVIPFMNSITNGGEKKDWDY